MENADIFTPAEAAQVLTALGVRRTAATLANERVLGSGPAFQKDLISGRVNYVGAALREYASKRIAACRSTAEAQTKAPAAIAEMKAIRAASQTDRAKRIAAEPERSLPSVGCALGNMP